MFKKTTLSSRMRSAPRLSRKSEWGGLFAASLATTAALILVVLFDFTFNPHGHGAATGAECGNMAKINRETFTSSTPQRNMQMESDTKSSLSDISGVVAGRDGLMSLPTTMIKQSQGANALCLAALGLHLDALNKFLATPGVDGARTAMPNDAQRTPLHCLAVAWSFGDSYPDSYILSLLQDTPHWLDHVPMDPPIERGVSSQAYSMRSVSHGARHLIAQIGKRLLEEGADPGALDADGFAPLHLACMGGGLDSLVTLLVEAGADLNPVTKHHGQTPLHLCALFGHASLLRQLVDAGGDPNAHDKYGNSPKDIATAAGSSVTPAELKRYFPEWQKVPLRKLSKASGEAMARAHGDGGWDTRPLDKDPSLSSSSSVERPPLPPLSAGDSQDPPMDRQAVVGSAAKNHKGKASRNGKGAQQPGDQEEGAGRGGDPSVVCDVDMLDVSREDPLEVFERYLMMNRPVLLRGVNQDSPAWEFFSKEGLVHEFGDLQVPTSDIPYSEKFGGLNREVDALGDFVQRMSVPRVSGDGSGRQRPWYIFLPKDESSDLVTPRTYPLDEFMRQLTFHAKGSKRAVNVYEDFSSLQFGLGSAGSGAQVHFHNTAWSQLFYGRKHWYFLPPRTTLMGKKQVLDWVEQDLEALVQTPGVEVLECVQRQGDVLLVPEYWGHAVLNMQDSVAVASEFNIVQYRPRSLAAYHDLSVGMGLSYYQGSFSPSPAAAPKAAAKAKASATPRIDDGDAGAGRELAESVVAAGDDKNPGSGGLRR